MLKKIDRGRRFLQHHASLFACPICHEAMQVTEQGLVCFHQHRFDVSKKGSLYFLDRQIKTEYDREMFLSRRNLIQQGMYQPLLTKIAEYLGEAEQVLDVGCGEGSFLQQLYKDGMTGIGFDIAKEGIYLATDHPEPLFWCVADLTNLPFRPNSFTTILNIFSPSNYQEFRRILKPGGQIIKVVPRSGYLQELREAFYPDDIQKQQYSNEKVVEKFNMAFPGASHEVLSYRFSVPESCQLDLLEMSPLEWGASEERKAILRQRPLQEISIDLELLVGKVPEIFLHE